MALGPRIALRGGVALGLVVLLRGGMALGLGMAFERIVRAHRLTLRAGSGGAYAGHCSIIIPAVRVAIDIDSTLHHYWDVLSAISIRRFGVELPYDEQLTWGITRLRPDQLELCIHESHSEQCILAGRPYPGAVETVRRWSAGGHFIHVTSHRDSACAPATEAWLERIGVPYDELHCSFDKVSRCAEIGIELLIDDSPANIAAAIDRKIAVAAILHPWNRDICEVEDVFAARDWQELALLLDPMLGASARQLARHR
jgi:hypothetical protein